MRTFEEQFYSYADSLLEAMSAFNKLSSSRSLREEKYNLDDLQTRMNRARMQYHNLQDVLRNNPDAAQRKVNTADFLDSATDLIKLLTYHYNAAVNMNGTGTPISNLNDFKSFCLENIDQLKQMMAQVR